MCVGCAWPTLWPAVRPTLWPIAHMACSKAYAAFTVMCMVICMPMHAIGHSADVFNGPSFVLVCVRTCVNMNT